MSNSALSSARFKRVPLNALRDHPQHARRMNPRIRQALKLHIGETGLYPPLIVRPCSESRYEILDGHHRAAILQELGHTCARCEIWPVDDVRGQLYLASLNHLIARSDSHVRAHGLKKLLKYFTAEALRSLLGMTPSALRQQQFLWSNGKETTRRPKPSGAFQSYQPVTFHLPSEQAGRLRKCLSRISENPAEYAGTLLKALETYRPQSTSQKENN
jgi:hypothetical protein